MMFVFFGASLAHAKAPDWVQPLLADDAAEISRGQNAVQLLDAAYVRYVTDDRVRRVVRGVIRPMTNSGRAYAHCHYRYNADTEKILAARAWIISPDGKRADAIATASFADRATQEGKYFFPQQRHLTYDASARVETRGAFAWEFEVESQAGLLDLHWNFILPLPVQHSVFEVTPPAGGRLEWHATSERILPPVAAGAPGALRWQMIALSAGTGALPDGFVPTPQIVSVRAVVPGRPNRVATWPDMARTAAEIIDPRIVVTPEIKAKAQALTAGRSGRWERIRALTEFVQKEITYLALTVDKDYLAGYRPHFAAEVLTNRYGDCKDKAALLAALLRAVGEDASNVLVFAGNPKAVRPDWPSAAFNHVITAIAADEAVPATWPTADGGPLGRVVLFDATDPNTPLGLLSSGDQGGFGLIASPRATGLVQLPVAEPALNRYDCTVRATLDALGDLTARVEENSRGAIGALLHAQRETLRNERFTSWLETRLHETIPLFNGLRWSDAWEAANGQWKLEFDFKAPRYARRTGGSLMLVSPQVLAARGRLAQWKTTQDGLAFSAGIAVRKEVRLTLPAGSTIEELPDDWQQELEFASCRLRYRREGADVIHECELTQRGGFLPKADYETLRAFVQKIHDAERRPILIRCELPEK